jgi:hypothetical protein
MQLGVLSIKSGWINCASCSTKYDHCMQIGFYLKDVLALQIETYHLGRRLESKQGLEADT